MLQRGCYRNLTLVGVLWFLADDRRRVVNKILVDWNVPWKPIPWFSFCLAFLLRVKLLITFDKSLKIASRLFRTNPLLHV